MKGFSWLGLMIVAIYAASILGGDAALLLLMALLGVLVIAVPLTLMAQRSDELQLGIDGLRTPREFFPWESIASVELDGHVIVIHGHDGYRGWVAPRLPGESHQEILDKLAELERGTLRKGPVSSEVGHGYRDKQQDPPEVLVRIAQDPTFEPDRRIDAFRRLDEARRREVLIELADEEFRRELERLEA